MFKHKLLISEANRYLKKGSGLLIALFITILFFIGVPMIARKFWPLILGGKAALQLSYSSFFLIWSLTQHNLLTLVCNTVYFVLYAYEFPAIEKYKANKDTWPWKKDPAAWRGVLLKSLKVYFLNTNVLPVLVYAPLTYFEAISHHAEAIEAIPSPVQLLVQLLFCMICDDFCFYWLHRLVHLPVLYRFHKMHHEHADSISITAEYAHPFEFLLGGLLPPAIGPAILGHRMHLVSVFAWYLVRVGEAIDQHSGYEFPFSPYRLLPMSGGS